MVPFLNSAQSLLKHYSFPLMLAIIIRGVLSLWLGFIWLLFLQSISQTDTALWETYHQMPPHNSSIEGAFAGAWLRWDAVHYMNIAYFGYSNLAPGEMNYWPLYPYLIRFIHLVTGGDVTFIGLLLSTFCTALALIFLYKLVLSKFHNEQLARWTILTWSLYPTSFFLFAPYTEALFASIAAGTFLMLYQKRWLAAGLFVFLGGLARSQGVLLLIPLFLEVLRTSILSRSLPNRSMIAAVFISPVGLLSYMIWRNQLAAMDIFASYQTYSQVMFVDPLRAIILAGKRLIAAPDFIQSTELLSIVLFSTLLVWMFTRVEFRKEYPLLTYGLAVVAFSMVKHNLAASPMQSSNRYVLNAIPAFIGMAWLLLKLPDPWRKSIITLSAATLLILSCLYTLWVFIG
jgi:hypothetical protein